MVGPQICRACTDRLVSENRGSVQCSARACACTALGTPAPRLRAPLTTLLSPGLVQDLRCLQLRARFTNENLSACHPDFKSSWVSVPGC